MADEKHWPEIRALILVVSADKKDTSSTAGVLVLLLFLGTQRFARRGYVSVFRLLLFFFVLGPSSGDDELDRGFEGQTSPL